MRGGNPGPNRIIRMVFPPGLLKADEIYKLRKNLIKEEAYLSL